MSKGDKTKKLRKAEKAVADYLGNQKKEEGSSASNRSSIKRSPMETCQCHAWKLPAHLQAACPYKKRI